MTEAGSPGPVNDVLREPDTDPATDIAPSDVENEAPLTETAEALEVATRLIAGRMVLMPVPQFLKPLARTYARWDRKLKCYVVKEGMEEVARGCAAYLPFYPM